MPDVPPTPSEIKAAEQAANNIYWLLANHHVDHLNSADMRILDDARLVLQRRVLGLTNVRPIFN